MGTETVRQYKQQRLESEIRNLTRLRDVQCDTMKTAFDKRIAELQRRIKLLQEGK